EAQHFLGDQASAISKLGVKNREASLEVRRLDVGDETPLETRAQPVFQGWDLLRRTDGGDDDLLVDLVKGIECVEELFLGPVFAREELHVVDQKHVDGAVLVPELPHAGG